MMLITAKIFLRNFKGFYANLVKTAVELGLVRSIFHYVL
jgi:hypothetical protein